MIECYEIKGMRYLRGERFVDIYESNIIFKSLSDAIEGSRKVYEDNLNRIEDDLLELYVHVNDHIDKNFFDDETGDFSIKDDAGYYANGHISKVYICSK